MLPLLLAFGVFGKVLYACVQGEVCEEDLQLYVDIYRVLFQIYVDKVCCVPPPRLIG